MKTALLIVDATPTFMPGGELPVQEGDQIIEPINRLITEGVFDEIVDLHEEHPPGHISYASTHGQKPFTTKVIKGTEYMLWPDHSIAGTANTKLHPAIRTEFVTLTALKGLRIDEECYGGFAYADGVPTGLRNQLKKRGVERNTVIGLATDYCVGTTALQSIENGFETDVILEACRAVEAKPGDTEKMLERLQAAGVRVYRSVDEYFAFNGMKNPTMEMKN